MAKDISELFNKAVDKFRTDREQREVSQGRPLNALERDFERVKEQVRQLKPQIETHPRFSHFWLFSDKIIIGFRAGPNQATFQLTVQLFHPGNHRFKKGLYDGYELALEGVDEAVEFVATQCGKLLA